MFLTAAVTILAVYIVSKTRTFLSGLKSVDYVPGFRPLFSPVTLLGAVIPTCWWNPGLNFVWEWRHTNFYKHSHDIVTMVPLLSGRPSYYTGSLDVLKQVLLNEGRTHLIKPSDLTSVLLLWGDNIVSANGDMWKRHRRTIGPAFNSKLYAEVWKESRAVYEEMVAAEGWRKRDENAIDSANALTMKFAFVVVSRCGFGVQVPWNDRSATPNTPTFGHDLEVAMQTSIARLIIPSWAYRLPSKWLREMDGTWKRLSKSIDIMVDEQVQSLAASDVGDNTSGELFRRLVSSLDSDSNDTLSRGEVIGNAFTMMFAGHETSAGVLAATLGLLAIHQDEQEKAYQEIMQTIPADREPVLEDMNGLKHLLACFQEASRIYPSGLFLSRDTNVDIPLKVTRPSEKTIVIKAGSRIIIDLIGVHHNPNDFPYPDRFIPSRWYGASETDISMFGAGSRACIGRRFANIETLAFLSALLKEWRVDIAARPGESRDEFSNRVMGDAGCVGLTFTVKKVPIKLYKRHA